MNAPFSIHSDSKAKESRTEPQDAGLQQLNRLAEAIQELSRATELPVVQRVVKSASRDLVRSDGVTFVLLDQGQCYYMDEDAIEPLWKGKRFPIDSCISGWVMKNRQPTVIEDIYQDTRIPHDAYRPTFVRSLVMVPIRSADPIGALGNYWATNHRASTYDVKLLQALADSASMAIEASQLHEDVRRLVRQRFDEPASESH